VIIWRLPILQQVAACAGGYLVSASAPHFDAFADALDQFVFLDPVLGPFDDHRLLSVAATGFGHRFEIGTGPSALDYVAGDSLVVEAEVALRLLKGRVENGVLNGVRGHLAPALMSVGSQNWTGSSVIGRLAVADAPCLRHKHEPARHDPPFRLRPTIHADGLVGAPSAEEGMLRNTHEMRLSLPQERVKRGALANW